MELGKISDPAARDRSGGLRAFGILAIVLGLACAALAALTPIAVYLQEGHSSVPVDPRSIILAVGVYAGLGAIFIACGIGSIRLRRWVRPILLILAWSWLFAGLLGLAYWLYVMPNLGAIIEESQPNAPELDPGALRVFALIFSGILILLYVLLPAAFVWFYNEASVKRTLERYDPKVSWTERCPLPVFGLSAGFAILAVMLLVGLVYRVMPVFGWILTGLPAIAVTLLLAALCWWMAVLTYRLRMLGWWGSLALSVLIPISSLVSVMRVGLVEIYKAMGMTPDQLEVIRSYESMTATVSIVATIALGLAGIVYMLAIRKYFVAPEQVSSGTIGTN